MKRTRVLTVLALSLAMTAVCYSADQSQQRGGPGRGLGSRNSLLGLLGREQVQKELKLTDEETAKVKEVVEKLRGEMREQYQALESIEDRNQRRVKLTQVSDELDEKLRVQLRDVVPREKMMRLYQIRMQVRPVVDSLTSRFLAEPLKLTDEQKAKLDEIKKDMQAKQSELFAKMREVSETGRSELFEKMRDLNTETDQKALGVLTEEQKKAFEEMKGEKFELQRERGRRDAT